MCRRLCADVLGMSQVRLLCSNAMTTLWLRDIIESARPGVQVQECESPDELLTAAEQDCDVIVLDVSACDAPAVVRGVRERSQHTVVLLLAAAADTDIAARAIAQGAQAVLSQTAHEAGLRATLALIWPVSAPGQPTTTVGRGGLTARELAILAAMAEGKSNAEIGAQLFVSPDTVKTQAKRLFARLGVHDRAAAVAAGLRRRLIV